MSRGGRIAAWSVAVVVAVLHLLVAGRYGFFRNELYFIVCGRHPAFGYVDQPPLVPLLAAATQLGGLHLWLLRLPAVIAAVLLVPLTVSFAQLLGAGTRGAWLAAIAAASAPLVTAMTPTLTTSTFEPLAFTGVAYFVTRAIILEERRAWWWTGIIAGLGFEAKYGILMWIAGLVAGVLIGPRSVLRSKDLWIGVAFAAILALPNVIWQIANGLPFLELVRNDNAGNLIGTPLVFALDQAFIVNILLAPLWIAGIVAPFVSKSTARYRYLSIAFVVTAVLVFGTHGKSYYMAGAYPAMFALGAAACTRLPRVLVAIWAVLAAVNGATALPFVLPVVSPASLKLELDHLSFRPRPIEVAAIGAPLMEPFSDEFGWRDLVRAVERVYDALPPADRARAAIYAENYGEAGAIDVLGRNLPPAISGNNQYYLWGPRGYDGSVVIAVNVDEAVWKTFCASTVVVARTGTPLYAMPYERGRPILLCRGMHPRLPQLWPRFKLYGLTNLTLR